VYDPRADEILGPNPRDLDAWRIYADLLEAEGDLVGTFISQQLAGLGEPNGAESALPTAYAELVGDLVPDGLVPDVITPDLYWKRGLAENVLCDVPQGWSVARWLELFCRARLTLGTTSLELTGDDCPAQELMDLPVRRGLTQLDVLCCEDDLHLPALQGVFPNLRQLKVTGDIRFSDSELPNLERLAIAEGGVVVGRLPRMPELVSLELPGQELNRHVEVLATFPKLDRLILGAGEVRLAELLESAALARLRHLDLRLCDLMPEEYVLMLDQPQRLAHLKTLQMPFGTPDDPSHWLMPPPAQPAAPELLPPLQSAAPVNFSVAAIQPEPRPTWPDLLGLLGFLAIVVSLAFLGSGARSTPTYKVPVLPSTAYQDIMADVLFSGPPAGSYDGWVAWKGAEVFSDEQGTHMRLDLGVGPMDPTPEVIMGYLVDSDVGGRFLAFDERIERDGERYYLRDVTPWPGLWGMDFVVEKFLADAAMWTEMDLLSCLVAVGRGQHPPPPSDWRLHLAGVPDVTAEARDYAPCE
jgi:hypothetical protein